MQKMLRLLWVAVLVFGPGCSFTQNVRRNLAVTPVLKYTDQSELHRSMQLGREAFRQMALQYSDQEFSCDYRKGFVEGFADYVSYGGTGEPPPMPTLKYRGFGYMTPEGLAAMEDWKLGWRHGAATAKVSNLRELTTLPVYWGPVFPTTPVNEPRAPKKADEETKLPAPKPLEPEGPKNPEAAIPVPEPPKDKPNPEPALPPKQP